jgi:hypothetical protein
MKELTNSRFDIYPHPFLLHHIEIYEQWIGIKEPAIYLCKLNIVTQTSQHE